MIYLVLFLLFVAIYSRTVDWNKVYKTTLFYLQGLVGPMPTLYILTFCLILKLRVNFFWRMFKNNSYFKRFKLYWNKVDQSPSILDLGSNRRLLSFYDHGSLVHLIIKPNPAFHNIQGIYDHKYNSCITDEVLPYFAYVQDMVMPSDIGEKTIRIHYKHGSDILVIKDNEVKLVPFSLLPSDEGEGSSNSDEESIKPDEESIKPDEESVKPDEESIKPDEESIKPDEESVKPDEESVKPDEESVKPDEELKLTGSKDPPPETAPPPRGEEPTPTPLPRKYLWLKG